MYGRRWGDKMNLRPFDYDVTFDEYQRESIKTAQKDYGMPSVVYYSLGLAGESGEVAEKIKKLFRDDKGILTEDRKAAIVKELGDCLWYLSAVAEEIGVTLAHVAVTNRKKLLDRIDRGVHSGDGDNR